MGAAAAPVVAAIAPTAAGPALASAAAGVTGGTGPTGAGWIMAAMTGAAGSPVAVEAGAAVPLGSPLPGALAPVVAASRRSVAPEAESSLPSLDFPLSEVDPASALVPAPAVPEPSELPFALPCACPS